MQTDQTPKREGVALWRALLEIVTILVVVGVVGSAVVVSYQWLANKPRARRRPPQKAATLVEVKSVRTGSHPVEVRAMGTVVPARQVVLTPRVGGEILSLHSDLVPGGLLQAGETAASVDPKDYALAVEERRADLARRKAERRQVEQQLAQREADRVRARIALDLEQARGEVAEQELALLGETLPERDRDRVLRKPQRIAAEASCQSAEAAKKMAEASLEAAVSSVRSAEIALEKAELARARTGTEAPFNAVVISTSVEKGAQVSPGARLATLVGTDVFWIEVAVPLRDLRWIVFPEGPDGEGSPVRIQHEAAWGEAAHRTGRVERLAAELEPQGRMARLIVSVEDPLCQLAENEGKPALILGAYVRAVIEGTELANVVTVPRLALRDGNRVWVMDAKDRLDIRDVEIVWRGEDEVCVREGLKDGERLVTSDLATPVRGMPLRTGAAPAGGGKGAGR